MQFFLKNKTKKNMLFNNLFKPVISQLTTGPQQTDQIDKD